MQVTVSFSSGSKPGPVTTHLLLAFEGAQKFERKLWVRSNVVLPLMPEFETVSVESERSDAPIHKQVKIFAFSDASLDDLRVKYDESEWIRPELSAVDNKKKHVELHLDIFPEKAPVSKNHCLVTLYHELDPCVSTCVWVECFRKDMLSIGCNR